MAYTDIDKPSDYFETKLYTGNGGTQSITGLDFQPNWVWIKDRDDTYKHILVDSVRGATKHLASNSIAVEITNTANVTSFTSDGFALSSDGNVNANADKYASWNWKETATAGFDIVSFTGNGSARTISHSLSAVPKMYIVKNRSTADLQWRVYHASLGATKFMCLDASQAVGTASSVFNNTEPTSSVFSVGTDDAANKNGDSLIAYLFAEKQGYSKFGSYVANGGGADSTFVYLGFKPAWIMVKKSSGTQSWYIGDNKRLGYNPKNENVNADTSGAEFSQDNWDVLSNGFKIKNNGAGVGTDGDTYIYMAFAENPFVTSSGVPATAR